MDDFFNMIWNSSFFAEYSPYVIIGIVIVMFLLIKSITKKMSFELFLKILGLIVGIIIFYCIIWYLDRIKI